MNERYLYRGKRKDNGEWAYGGLDTDWGLEPEQRDRYWIIQAYLGEALVIPETVGQCTGAKLGEQNLFDGDLLSYIGETYEIVWDENFLVWSVKNKKGDICFNLNTILRDKKRECKLIASKSDNPELLKVEK